MAKNKCPECPKCLPGWLVQFGGLMSLLLTFFILLLSMAVMDKKKVEEYFDIMKKAMGFIDASTDVETQSDAYSTKNNDSSTEENDSSSESDFDSTAQDVSQIVDEVNSSQSIETQEIKMEKGKNEFVLDIPSTVKTSLPISRAILNPINGYLRLDGLISSNSIFSRLLLLEVACFDLATLALKRRINSSNSAFFSSAFLFCCAFCLAAN